LLDDLYRSHPSEFVAARDELAKKLREDGEREEADRVKKLRRPSAAAWLLNLVALANPKVLKEFAKASGDLENAQARALEGRDEGAAKWRAAAAREREAAPAVIEVAEKEASDAGHSATTQALDLVDGTLRAAAADPELRDQVVAGRLEREQSGATIGAAGLVAAPSSSSRRKTPAKERDSARKREAAQAGREVKRLERLITEAEAREVRRQGEVDATTEALRREKADLAAAKKETTGLRRELKAAQKRA
jgi:hypothetical protein